MVLLKGIGSHPATRKGETSTCLDHAAAWISFGLRRRTTTSRTLRTEQLQKTLLLEDTLLVNLLEASYLMRARICFSGDGGPSFIKLPETPPNHNRPPTTACRRPRGETTAHLVLPVQQHLARDIGAQPDPQDLDTAPSSAFSARPGY
jgi:hypothetical protein